MKSEAYQKLYELSESSVFPLGNDEEYNSIAVHIILTLMNFKWMPHTTQDVKDVVLDLLPGLSDTEWEEVHKRMLAAVPKRTFGATGLELICSLDTLREFERE